MGGSFFSGFVVVGAGEVPVVVGGEQAQDDDDGGAEEHGGVAAERAPAQRADQLFQQQVHLVDVVAGGLVGGAVDGDTVPHLIVIGNPPLLPYLPIW